jgi:hypothetical protein
MGTRRFAEAILAARSVRASWRLCAAPLRLMCLPAFVVSVVVGLFVLLPAVAMAEPLCTDSWVGGAEGSWQTGASWSSGSAPTSTDVACIGSGKAVKVTEGAQQAGVVQGEGSVVVSGGSLEVVTVLEPSSLRNLTVAGGVLTGPAEVQVTGSFSGGGTIGSRMEGAGKTVIESGASGTFVKGKDLILRKRSLVIEEGATAKEEKEAGIIGKEGAAIVNHGTLTLNGEGEVGGLFSESPEPKPTLTNTGTVQKTEGTGKTLISFLVDNENKITTTKGTIELLGGGTSGIEKSGSWTASGAGTVISFKTGSYSLGASVTMSGTITVPEATVKAGEIEGAAASISITNTGCCSKGTVEITGTTPSTLEALVLESGTLTGSGEVDVTSSASTHTGRLEGTGKTVIESGASGTVTSGSDTRMKKRTLVVNGSLTEVAGAGIVGQEGAKIVNNGTLILNGEGEVAGLFFESPGPTPVLVNNGTMRKTEGRASCIYSSPLKI